MITDPLLIKCLAGFGGLFITVLMVWLGSPAQRADDADANVDTKHR